jgi:hypothetical protein
MTFPFGYNVSSVKKAGIVTKTISKKFYDLRITQVKTTFGNVVTVEQIDDKNIQILFNPQIEDENIKI